MTATQVPLPGPEDDIAPAESPVPMFLSREAIRTASDLPMEAVAVPEWGGSVCVRTLTGRERDEFEDALVSKKGRKREVVLRDIRARLVSLSVCDVNGASLFTVEDIPWLTQKSAAALDRIFSVAQRLSGLTPQDVEELAKNSDAGPGSASA